MKSTFIHAASTLIRIQEARFKEASRHSQRVAFYALMLSKELGMSGKEQKHIYLAGLLHDIGKLGIPDSCLFKPGKLTGEEWREIKKHPVFSYEILSAIPEMENISVMALYHHERYDGKGYPEGLRGEAIPLGARLLAVADSFDAMTSYRVYRPQMSFQMAIEELCRCAGTQFDPRFVEAFCRLWKREDMSNSGHFESAFRAIIGNDLNSKR